MTPSIHWLTDHSPITHTDPPSPPILQYGLLSLAQLYNVYSLWYLSKTCTEESDHKFKIWSSGGTICIVCKVSHQVEARKAETEVEERRKEQEEETPKFWNWRRVFQCTAVLFVISIHVGRVSSCWGLFWRRCQIYCHGAQNIVFSSLTELDISEEIKKTYPKSKETSPLEPGKGGHFPVKITTVPHPSTPHPPFTVHWFDN